MRYTLAMWWKKRIYLDSASGVAGNPSSPHKEGSDAKKRMEDARQVIARLVEVQSDDVIFTSGATESNALAILGYVRALRALAGPDTAGRNNMHVLYLPSSHASIVENVKMLVDEGVTIEALPIANYRVDIDALTKLIRPETVLVSMDAVCGETGVVWNTREVAEVLKKKKIRLHVDASQAPWTEKITRDHFGADFLTFDASKVGEVRGIGVLIAHRAIPLVPLYKGGGQERGLRSGTESPFLAEHFAEALLSVNEGRESFKTETKHNRDLLISLLVPSLKDIFVQEGRAQAPHILNLALPGRDTDYLVALLDEAGFALSTRSACETDSEEGSRAVFALTGDQEKARSTIRISWGPSLRTRDLICFAKAFTKAVVFIDSNRVR